MVDDGASTGTSCVVDDVGHRIPNRYPISHIDIQIDTPLALRPCGAVFSAALFTGATMFAVINSVWSTSFTRSRMNYTVAYVNGVAGRGLHSFPFLLNLSLPCPFPLNLSLLCPLHNSNSTRGCGPKVLKFNSNVSDVSRRSSS